MSNVSIYEKNWIDLVFENKNKAYGAYQLRQENSRTTLFAFFGGITLILLLLGAWYLFSSFSSKPEIPTIDTPLRPTIIPFTVEPKKEIIKPKTEKEQSSSAANTNPFQKYVAAPLVDNEVLKTTETESPISTTGQDNGTGPSTDNSTDGGSPTGTAISVPVIINEPVSTTVLDRLPEYPGGIKKFYEYVGNNFEKPDVDEHISAISVIMSFVIEKDGAMSNIKAVRSSDKFMEREAIRVLKSLKVKWTPGYKDGEKMRTFYTLPIKVAL
jgi:protein TonB